jgi:hypothetical protein
MSRKIWALRAFGPVTIHAGTRTRKHSPDAAETSTRDDPPTAGYTENSLRMRRPLGRYAGSGEAPGRAGYSGAAVGAGTGASVRGAGPRGGQLDLNGRAGIEPKNCGRRHE